MPIVALNVPENWDMINTTALEKFASISKTKKIDLDGFDIAAAAKENPEHLFVKVFAIKKDEVNDNGDAFSASELKKAAHTFVDCPVFVNHQNDDVEKSRGKVIHAWYDDKAGGIYCINRVDKVAYPQLARGIQEGYISGTSMGAQVGFSLCSVCHNKAHTADDFCSHIKNQKTRQFSGSVKNAYHDSNCKPDDNDPLTGKKIDAEEMLDHKEAQVFEWNYDIKFIEDSFVVNPACHDCLVCDILDVGNIEQKMASQLSSLKKVASRYEKEISSKRMEKTAGKMEIQALNDAMNLIEKVTRSILAQKQQVDMEYASDLIEVLADLQGQTDELIEMGYNALPSPTESEIAFGTDALASPADGEGGAEQVSPEQIGSGQQRQAPRPQVSGVESSPAPEVGTVTRPNFSAASQDNGEDLIKESSNIVHQKLQHINVGLKWANKLLEFEERRANDTNTICEASLNNRKIAIAKTDSGELRVGEWHGSKLVSWVSADKYDNNMRNLLDNNPKEAAQSILLSLEKESDLTMAKENKTAAGSGVNEEQNEVTTQKQLDKANLELHGRQESHYETITEGSDQIGGSERTNDTSTNSAQVRLDAPYEFITQAQLEEIKEYPMSRWSSYPEVITEKQWDDMSRLVSSILPEDWTESTTQAQLISLRDSHSWADPEFITQEQLANQGSTLPHGGDTARWKAASFDAKALVTAASNAVSDAIANYGLTPTDVRQAVATFSMTPKHEMKAAYLTLVNAIPTKIAERKSQNERDSYFGKVAGRTSSTKAIDGLLAAMGDNIKFASASDFIDAVAFVANDKVALASSEKNALEKMASTKTVETVVDKTEQFRQAFAEIDNNDGLYKICGTISEDLNGVDVSDKKAFINSILSYSQTQIDNKDIIIANVSVDAELGIFEAVVKESSVATEEEKTAFANLSLTKTANTDEDECDNKEDSEEKTASRKDSREQLAKEAQMMGGQMPAGLGDGGGGGASMPTAPGDGDGEAIESFDAGGDEGFEDEGTGDLEASPPGSICPVCGADDVDIISGKGQCNNCGAEYSMKIDIEVLKWPGTMDNDGGEEVEEEGFGGEGLAIDDGGLDQELPVAAFTRITDKSMEKLASQKIILGSVSPYTGSTDTLAMGDGEYFCLSTGNRYNIRQAMKGDDLYMQWEWKNRPAASDCVSCKRAKKTFASALKDFGIKESEFDSMTLADRGRAILAMNDKGLLNRVKTASVENGTLKEFKKAYNIGDKFPTERCRELIARRFGEEAIALSGPDEGCNLADSICKRLAKASIYSDNMVVKIANHWMEPDGCIMCLEDFIRGGFTAKQSSFVCDQLRTKYAQAVEFLSDELGSDMGDNEDVDVIGDEFGVEIGGEDGFDESVDPFSDEGAEGFVNVSLPLEVLHTLNSEIAQALEGNNGMDEGSDIEEDLPMGEEELGLPEDASSEIGDVAEDALDAAVDITEDIGESLGGENEEDGDDDDDPFDGGPSGFDADGEEDDAEKEGMSMPNSFASNENEEIMKESSDDSENTEDTEEEGADMKEASSMAETYKRGRIAKSHSVGLDLSAVSALLSKQAGDSKIVQKNVQDDSDINPISGSDGSTMGHEEKFTAENPDAPSSGATMGHESKDLTKTDVPSIPAGGSAMGGEADQGYTPEKGHDYTGGTDGAGNSKAASTKASQNGLAERLIIEADKKLNEAKPVSEDKDIQPISNNKDHSNTPEGSKITPSEESDKVSVPENGSGAFMGHEEESIGAVPKAPEHQPEIPSGGGKGPENERFAPEKQEDIKGTVIARSNEESSSTRKEAAIRVAGRMLEAKQITAGQLPVKIAELERYESEQILDLEKAMFGVVRKGLNTVAQGSETAFIVPETSNLRDANTELTSKIQGLFQLDRRNRAASEGPNADLMR